MLKQVVELCVNACFYVCCQPHFVSSQFYSPAVQVTANVRGQLKTFVCLRSLDEQKEEAVKSELIPSNVLVISLLCCKY